MTTLLTFMSTLKRLSVDYWAGDTLGEETFTSSGIDPIKGTRVIIKYARRAFDLHTLLLKI